MSEGTLPALGVDGPGEAPGDPAPSAGAADASPAPPDEARPARPTRWRGGRRLSTGHEIYWWVEIGIVLVFDLIYESLRDLNSSGTAHAYDNALRLIGWERDLHIYDEHAWQSLDAGPRQVGHHRQQLLLRRDLHRRHHRRPRLLVPALPGQLPVVAQHAGRRDVAGPHRLRHLPAHAPAAARHVRPPRRLPLRRHAREVPDVLVVQLVGHEEHLEPVRGHAEPALRMGAVGLCRVPAAGEVVVGQGVGPALPGGHHHGGRRHRQPLLPRCGGRGAHLHRRLRPGSPVHPRRPGPQGRRRADRHPHLDRPGRRRPDRSPLLGFWRL